MAQQKMSMAEFKRLMQAQTRERLDAAPPKRRKGKDHYRAKYAATPTSPALTAEEKARQRALFSRHGEAIIDIRLPLPNSKNALEAPSRSRPESLVHLHHARRHRVYRGRASSMDGSEQRLDTRPANGTIANHRAVLHGPQW